MSEHVTEHIQCVNIHKSYLNKKALSNINLKLSAGRIVGLLGPNGSGKTTLMKIIANLHKQSSGDILVMGEPPSHKTRAYVAFMPTENFIYPWMRVRDALTFYEDMYPDFDRKQAQELADFMELDSKQKVSTLSTGQKSRLKILLTISRNAEIYMLDEPLNGLDPISRAKIKTVILERFDRQKLMLISTHLVSEIEQILDDVFFMRNGEIILEGEAEAIRMQYAKGLEDIYREVFAHA